MDRGDNGPNQSSRPPSPFLSGDVARDEMENNEPDSSVDERLLLSQVEARKKKHEKKRSAVSDAEVATIFLLVGITVAVLMTTVMVCFFTPDTSKIADDQRTAWNLTGLQQQFEEHVYGQQEAMDTLITVMREALSRENSNSWLKIIALIGGPGVGKNHTIEIIKKHLENFTTTGQIENYIHYEHQPMEGVKGVDFMYINNFNFTNIYLKHEDGMDVNDLAILLKNTIKSLHDKKNKAFLFLSGNVMSEEQVDLFYDSREYEFFLNTVARSLEKYLAHHSLTFYVDIVQFQPLTTDAVSRCLKDQGMQVSVVDSLLHTWRLRRRNFVPRGCGTL